MTSVFSWQNSISLCSASFYTPRPNLPVTPGISFFPQVSLDFQLLHSNLLWRKGLLLSFCGVSSRRSYMYSLYVYMFLTQQSEKAMAPHSSTLVWKIPWMEEPDRLQFMESQRVGHDWVTSLSFFFSKHFTDVHLHNLISLPNKDWGTTQTHGDTWISLAQCLISRVIKTHLQNKQVHS